MGFAAALDIGLDAVLGQDGAVLGPVPAVEPGQVIEVTPLPQAQARRKAF
jgi:hypothetical protein